MTRFVGATPDQMQGPAHACNRPVLLHVGHSWGGGIERWICDYAAADPDNWNLLLRSRTWRNEAGVQLELVDLAAGGEILLAWKMEDPIACTALQHGQYRRILEEVIASFAVEAVVVSSLIGHALEVLGTGLPTVVVLHDFVPFCPGLFAWFGQPCTSCDKAALARCLATNPYNAFWHLDDAGQWLALREAYARQLAKPEIRVAAPARSIHDRYATLFPVLRDKPWRQISHGLSNLPRASRAPAAQAAAEHSGQQRLRVIVPGRLLPHKGLHLLSAIIGELTQFADLLLLGCGDYGLPFRDVEHVKVVPDYDNEALSDHVRDFVPDCALLLSVIPESFSYTLSEMSALQIPVLATRLGAFAERIEDGSNGLLVEPNPQAVLQRLKDLANDRTSLERVMAVLRKQPVRSASAMVAEYRELLGLDAGGAERKRPRPGLLAQATVREAAARRYLREENARRQQQFIQMSDRIQRLEQWAEALDKRAGAQQLRADAQEKRADAQEKRADAQEKRADAQEKRAVALDRELGNQRARVQRLMSQLAEVEAHRDMILSSTSWRVTSPLRAATDLVRRRLPAADVGAVASGPESLAADGPAERAAEVLTEAAPAAMPEPAADARPQTAPRAKAAAAPGAVRAATESPEAPTTSVVGSGSSAPQAESVQAPRAEVDWGDVLGVARARRLEQVLGIPMEQAPSHRTDDVPDGFSLVLRGAGPVGARRTVACFEGLDDAPQDAATALAMQLDRVLVPTQGIARSFRALWPDARAQLSVIPFPLAAEWPSAIDRDSQRILRRERLGLPDRTSLVIGIGRVGSLSGLIRFAALTTLTCARRNDVRFVWLGARKPDWERANWMAVGLPVAMRQLFLVEDRDFAGWLQGGDAYIGCRAPHVHDAGAAEALAAGLPVCVASMDSLSDTLRDPPCNELVDAVEGDAVTGWLSERLANPRRDERQDDSEPVRQLLECAGDPDLMVRFLAEYTKFD